MFNEARPHYSLSHYFNQHITMDGVVHSIPFIITYHNKYKPGFLLAIVLHVASNSINTIYDHGNMVLHGYLHRNING